VQIGCPTAAGHESARGSPGSVDQAHTGPDLAGESSQLALDGHTELKSGMGMKGGASNRSKTKAPGEGEKGGRDRGKHRLVPAAREARTVALGW
jgi:hypothetical protein